MLNLFEFYKKNIKQDDYYYRFYNQLVTAPEKSKLELEEIFGSSGETDDSCYEVFDEVEAIRKLRDLCEPNLTFDTNNMTLFYLVCFCLNNYGYMIQEFPSLLKRPPLNPSDFTINDIRNMAFSLKLNDGNTIHYQTRRRIVENLHFIKSEECKIDDDINCKFQEISTRNARFENMTLDERIKEIINLIENLLKKDGKYLKLDYEKLSCDFINEKIIIDYKNKMQCFRHSSDESLKERKQYTDLQKSFIVDYGIMICNLIYKNN